MLTGAFLLFFGASTSAWAIDDPVSPNASPEARSLLAYLDSIHGEKILSGQQETVDWFGNSDDTEMDHLQNLTGKLPAIRGFDYLFLSDPRNTYQRIAERAIDWAEAGGIAAIAWHWFMEVDSPNGPAFYTPGAHDTQFTNYDIREAMQDGTDENAEFMAELDMIAEDLKILRDANVPILWRPFHEVGGIWFWWSAHGPEPFKWAWRTMFERFTSHHGLNNLLWVYNPNDLQILTDWDPGEQYYDLVTLDVYPNSGHPVYATEYAQYRDYTDGRKLTALSENGRMPDPDLLEAQDVGWVYFMTWDRAFITGEDHNDFAFQQHVYTHERVLTRDELPDVYTFGRSPTFVTQPVSTVVNPGADVTLTAQASANESFTYQWYRDNIELAGETDASLTLSGVSSGNSGRYVVKATSSVGTTTSQVATVVVGSPDGRIVNLATRGQSRLGFENMVVGFVLEGTGTHQVLIRGVGPGLVPLGLPANEVLTDPQLELFRGTESILTNDNWGDATGDPAAVGSALGAFGLPDGSKDSALVTALEPGSYTVSITGADGGTGITIAEMYDANASDDGARLVNLSTRAYVGSGNAVLIPGIVVNQAPRRLLVRGIGPGLTQWIPDGTLPDPVVRLVDVDGNTVNESDDWGTAATSPEVAAAFAATGAFQLEDGSKDAAMVVVLPTGSYTALVSDRNGAQGIALVEVYEMDP